MGSSVYNFDDLSPAAYYRGSQNYHIIGSFLHCHQFSLIFFFKCNPFPRSISFRFCMSGWSLGIGNGPSLILPILSHLKDFSTFLQIFYKLLLNYRPLTLVEGFFHLVSNFYAFLFPLTVLRGQNVSTSGIVLECVIQTLGSAHQVSQGTHACHFLDFRAGQVVKH